MEAAETSLMSASAFLRRVTLLSNGVFWRKLIVPSIIISVKGVWVARICLMARRVASLRAAERPILSSSVAETQPVA